MSADTTAELLDKPIGPHTEYDCPYILSLPGREFRAFNLNLDGLLIGSINGDSRGRNKTPAVDGFPQPTIPEAEAIRAEIIRRWNAFPKIIAALQIADVLCTRFGPEPETCDYHERESWIAIRNALRSANVTPNSQP